MKIDRSKKEDVLKQIGRTQSNIEHLNRQQSEFDKEINGWPKRLEYLKMRKWSIQNKISKMHSYINQLENDLKE